MKWRIALAALVVIGASLVARAQFQTGGNGVGAPGGSNAVVQFNTNGIFGGISGVTSDQANIGFTTSSKLILYGITTGNCLKVDANNQISDAGIPCGGTSATNIAAGSNITTSGSAANVTVNVVATPSFTTVIASGNVTAGSAQFTGAVSGTTAQFQTITDSGFSAAQQCVQATNGILAGTGSPCSTATATSIAAGSNVTTSGTASNVTVNVVATPTFTSVTSTLVGITGWLTAPGASLQTATIASLGATTQCLESVAGVVTGLGTPCATQTSTPSIAAGTNITTSGTAANTTVNVVATPSFTTVIASQNMTAATAQFTGFLSAGGASISGLSLATGTISGNLTGSTANLSGNLTAGTAQFTGAVTGTTAVFQTITDALLGGCLNATSGVISSTGVSCATQTSTPSIAAGTNITTSGTAANTTVNLVATPSVTTLIASGNLTAATAQFSGFLTAGGASLSGLTIVTATHTGNLTGTTANFSGNLTGTTAQFTGAVTGTSAQFQTYTGSTANLSGNLTGTTAQFSSAVTGTTATWQTDTAGFLTLSQFVNWGGESRMSANPFLTVTVGTLTPSGLSINVAGGRNYSVEADLYIGTSVNTGGFQMALSGTGGWSNVNYFGYVVDGGSNNSAAGASNPIRGAAIATTKTTAVGNGVLSGPNGYAKLSGTITTVNAGTIQVWVAQNTANATHQLTITQGSRLFVHDMP